MGSETRMKHPGVGTLIGHVNAPSWFILGLAVGFLFTSSMSFAFHGLFGIYYLSVGILCAGAAVAFALRGHRTGST